MSLPDNWDGTAFMTPSTANSRLGKMAEWVVDGVDQANVGVTDFGNYFQLHMPGQAYDEEFYLDEAYPAFSFTTPSDAWKRLVTIEPLSVAPYRIAVGPTLRAIEAQPLLEQVPGTSNYDTFCGSQYYPYDGGGLFPAPNNTPLGIAQLPPPTMPIYPAFLLPSTADLRIYHYYPVYDPDDLPTGTTQGTMFCGLGWYDYPPFTIEVDVFMAGQRSVGELAVNDFVETAGFTFPMDNSAIVYVASAIESARAMRDLTLMQPKPTPLFTASQPFLVGTNHYVIGQAQLSV